MTPDEIAVWVGAESFSRVRRILALTFRSGPGPQIVTTDAVAATVVAEWNARRAAHPASAVRPQCVQNAAAAGARGAEQNQQGAVPYLTPNNGGSAAVL